MASNLQIYLKDEASVVAALFDPIAEAVLMWKRNGKFLVVASLIGVGWIAQPQLARAGEGCLSLKQMHAELAAQGSNLEENDVVYDMNGVGLKSLDPTTLGEWAKNSRRSNDIQSLPLKNSIFGEFDPSQSVCKPGATLDLPELGRTNKWVVISSSPDSLKIQEAGNHPGKADVIEIHKTGSGQYELYFTMVYDKQVFDYCQSGASGNPPHEIKNFSTTQVWVIGPKGSLPDQMPISSHMTNLFMNAVLAEPNPICPAPQMQNTDFRKTVPAQENGSGEGPGGCCAVKSDSGAAL